jgi:hypothetical protein
MLTQRNKPRESGEQLWVCGIWRLFFIERSRIHHDSEKMMVDKSAEKLDTYIVNV